MNTASQTNVLLQTITYTTADVSPGTSPVTSLSVVDPGIFIPSGTTLYLLDPGGSRNTFQLTSDCNSGDTTLTSSGLGDRSTKTEDGIPKDTIVMLKARDIYTKAINKHIYAHQSIYLTTGTNGNDYLSAYGTSAFSVNSAVTLATGNSKPNRWSAQYAIYVAPRSATINEIRGTASSDAGSGDDCVISIWKATPNTGATGNITITAVKQFTLTSQNNQNHVFSLQDSPTTNNTLAAGDIVFFSIRRTGALNSGVEWYADCGLDITYNV
jgi:hypothetical protein